MIISDLFFYGVSCVPISHDPMGIPLQSQILYTIPSYYNIVNKIMTKQLTAIFYEFLRENHIYMEPIYCLENLEDRVFDITIKSNLTLSLDCDYEKSEIGLITQYAIKFANENQIEWRNLIIKFL